MPAQSLASAWSFAAVRCAAFRAADNCRLGSSAHCHQRLENNRNVKVASRRAPNARGTTFHANPPSRLTRSSARNNPLRVMMLHCARLKVGAGLGFICQQHLLVFEWDEEGVWFVPSRWPFTKAGSVIRILHVS